MGSIFARPPCKRLDFIGYVEAPQPFLEIPLTLVIGGLTWAWVGGQIYSHLVCTYNCKVSFRSVGTQNPVSRKLRTKGDA